MGGFFDFIKKSSSNANGPVQTGQPYVAPAAPQQILVQQAPAIQQPVLRPVYSAAGTPAVAQTPMSPSMQQTPTAPKISTPAQVGTDAMNHVSTTSAPTAPSSIASTLTNQQRGDIDVMTHLTQRSNRVFLSANSKAKELQDTFVDSEHLLHGLLSDGEIYKLLTDLKVAPQMIEDELSKIYKHEANTAVPQMSPRVKRIIDSSLVVARKLGFEFISPEHMLLSLYEEGEGMGAKILAKLGLKKEDLNKKVLGKKEGLEEGQKQNQKSVLEQFTIDLTAKAAEGRLDPVVERSEVVERVIHILSRRSKNNPALVGEAGVGKTAVVEGLAEKIAAKQVPESLLEKRILQLDLMSILAGASHRGEFEERMKNLIEEIKASQGKIILFIDEIHTIVGAGGSGDGSIDAANFLKPALARGEMQLIGATTLTEYRKYIEKDPALERRFQPVLVPEPTEEQAIKMLKSTKDKYEAFHRVKIPDEAVEIAVKLSKRYVGDRFLPDKAVDLIDEAASAVRLPMLSLPEEIKSLEERIAELKQEVIESEKAGDPVKARITRSKIDDIQAQLNEKKEAYEVKKAQTTTEVTEDIIKEIVSRWTGIPVAKLTGSEMGKLANLEQIMHERMIGQESAVTSVAQAVRRGRAGLKSNQRPIGSFVFLGPTGVGKTELAKTLADILFGQEEAMLRFDMTEFMEKHEVAKLLGAPPGYVGYEEGGKLTEAVRRKPYSVVLFDEVEKAHPDIFNILLQILDDGRLTDNKGHVISFKNTVVICTSNIGSQVIQEELLKEGKGEVEEPPVLSTFTFSPQGKEIFTMGSKYFERENATATAWKEGMLQDYFSGQKVHKSDEYAEDINLPTLGYDTHAISSKGVEVITKGEMVYFRTSSQDKEWQVSGLGTYFKDNTVVNAMPGAEDEQLPTVGIKTHTFTPDDMEVITLKDRYWTRKADANEWQTGFLKDYFVDTTTENGTLPQTYWDIHTFSSTGREVIIVGEQLWYREAKEKMWKQQTLKEYFGGTFPLEQHLEEKQQVEEETDKKKNELLKDKVMNELRKFFRPELINRFDEVIVFEPLKFSDMAKIVKLQLKSVGKLLEDQEMGFSYTDTAIKEVVRSGFDPVFGARPLRRAIQKLVENPLSSLIIDGQLKPGDTVEVDFDGENFAFNVERVEVVPSNTSSSTNDIQKPLKVQTYNCEHCLNAYKSDVYANSTPICPKCGSCNVHPSTQTEQKTPEAPTQTPPSTQEMQMPQSVASA